MINTIKTSSIIDFFKKKETLSVVLILLFLVLALSCMFISPQAYKRTLHEGDIALKDTYAPYNFTYKWEIDEEATAMAKDEATATVPIYMKRNYEKEEQSTSDITVFFVLLEEVNAQEITPAEKLAAIKSNDKVSLPPKAVKVMLDSSDPDKLRSASMLIIKDLYESGIVGNGEFSDLTSNNITAVVVPSKDGEEIKTVEVNSLVEGGILRDAVEKKVSDGLESDWKTRQALASLINGYISVNVEIDVEMTEAEREAVASLVQPIYSTWEVKKNEIIIEKGQRINARNLAQLSELRRVFRRGVTPAFFMGALLIFLVMGFMVSVYISFTEKGNYLTHTKKIGIILINLLGIIILADFVTRSPQPTFFIPLAGMSMMLLLLVGFNVTFITTVVMSILLAVMFGGNIELVFVLLTGSIVGMFVIKGARRRANILWAALFVGIAKSVALSCIGLINGMGMDYFLKAAVWGIASGLFSGLIVMGIMPIFEYFFKISTNISLLELSDLNHPLLKRLAMEAPGTYHHCIMVGNLSEAACDAIGANSLMSRVGAYYHDIGKVAKAEYFSENEMASGSRHAKLSPSMSALIIGKHVKDGMEIAKKHKLNNTIVDFITQHHGTSLISFFYQKALERSEGGILPSERNFRYPGPKPQTKESAIVLLADSVEASSRSLDAPTPASIRNLVKKIVNNKFIDGQLDECDLTLRDMHQIADSFVHVLMGIFHTRLVYPDEKKSQSEENENENKDILSKPKQKKKSKPGKNGEDS